MQPALKRSVRHAALFIGSSVAVATVVIPTFNVTNCASEEEDDDSDKKDEKKIPKSFVMKGQRHRIFGKKRETLYIPEDRRHDEDEHANYNFDINKIKKESLDEELYRLLCECRGDALACMTAALKSKRDNHGEIVLDLELSNLELFKQFELLAPRYQDSTNRWAEVELREDLVRQCYDAAKNRNLPKFLVVGQADIAKLGNAAVSKYGTDKLVGDYDETSPPVRAIQFKYENGRIACLVCVPKELRGVVEVSSYAAKYVVSEPPSSVVERARETHRIMVDYILGKAAMMFLEGWRESGSKLPNAVQLARGGATVANALLCGVPADVSTLARPPTFLDYDVHRKCGARQWDKRNLGLDVYVML